MDGQLPAITVFVGRMHELKFTYCYCTKQPQFATELFSRQPMPISMRARTVTENSECPEPI
jgi:hypothetical protein